MPFESFPMMKNRKFSLFSFLFLSLLLTACALGTYSPGTLYRLSAQPLSLNLPLVRNCVFDSQFSILHFPMIHPSPYHYSPEDYEQVVLSQFQLLHTILDYKKAGKNVLLFDENNTQDFFDEINYSRILSSNMTYERLDGTHFQLRERIQTANHLFAQGIPRYYEHLNKLQKDFLFNSGASFTLYFLKKIPKIHKVISVSDHELVLSHIQDISGTLQLEGEESEYWQFAFRESRLREEVLKVFRTLNTQVLSQNLILIAYGFKHDFTDEFAGFPFQSGSFCLKWKN